MKKTLVIFDLDGTLVYCNKIDSECFARTYHYIYGKPFPTIDWTKYPHVTDTAIFGTVIQDQFERDVTAQEIIEFQHEFVAMIEEKRKLEPHEFMEVPGAKQVVEKLLEDERFEVGVGTGGWYRPAMVKLRHVDIPTDLLVIVGADGHEKREGIIGQVMQTVAARTVFHRTVYVGDAIWDVNTTRRMGMDFVGVRRSGDFEVLQREGTSVVIQDYLDFGEFLRAVDAAVPPGFPVK
ncbi:MAG: HAD family hydrolase [Saprospiraceae bacterium]|nr:HAD family hydrolase [Saprospiraceae bacterium]